MGYIIVGASGLAIGFITGLLAGRKHKALADAVAAEANAVKAKVESVT